MFVIRTIVLTVVISIWYSCAKAEPRDLQMCEAHLSKYRRFLLQAILNFEDVCDAYNARPLTTGDSNLPPQIAFFGHYQPPEQKAEVWTFFKLIMGQISDSDFANVVRDAIVDRCRIKLQLQQMPQRDEKRNTVVLGKKQRFHSWGGKRSGVPAVNEMDQDHIDDLALAY